MHWERSNLRIQLGRNWARSGNPPSLCYKYRSPCFSDPHTLLPLLPGESPWCLLIQVEHQSLHSVKCLVFVACTSSSSTSWYMTSVQHELKAHTWKCSVMRGKFKTFAIFQLVWRVITWATVVILCRVTFFVDNINRTKVWSLCTVMILWFRDGVVKRFVACLEPLQRTRSRLNCCKTGFMDSTKLLSLNLWSKHFRFLIVCVLFLIFL
jgi:hypothetical protein